MTQSTTRSFVDHMLANGPVRHPHLAQPLNFHALRRERVAAIQSLESLIAYQRFLDSARAVKAERRRVSHEFERHVQAQSRQALSDLDSFLDSALRAPAQRSQPDYWQTLLRQTAAALNDTGPTTVQDLWRDVRGRQDIMSVLEEFGFNDAMVAMSDQAFATADATLSTIDGRIQVTDRRHGPDDGLHTITLIAKRGQPKTVTELLGRASLGQVTAAFSQADGGGYIPALSSRTSDFEPDELVALAALASRQLFVDEVRRLEDRGLATQSGGDLTFLVGLLVVGLVLYLIGLGIGATCAEVQGNDPFCTVGSILTIVGMVAVAFAVFGLFFAGVPLLANVAAISVSSGLVLLGGGIIIGTGVFFLLLTIANFSGALDATGFEAPNIPIEEPT